MNRGVWETLVLIGIISLIFLLKWLSEAPDRRHQAICDKFLFEPMTAPSQETQLDGNTLSFGRTPSQCEIEALAAEKRGEFGAAAQWWLAAQITQTNAVEISSPGKDRAVAVRRLHAYARKRQQANGNANVIANLQWRQTGSK